MTTRPFSTPPGGSKPSAAPPPEHAPSIVPEARPSIINVPSLMPSMSPRPSITPVDHLPADGVLAQESELERELVKQLRTGRAALPVLPQVAQSALRLANDYDARIDELARLVDTDPPIAARFMSVANSAAYWRGMVTSSTRSAIVRLGLANTRDLLFQVVYAASTTGLKKYQTMVLRSFKRSVLAAVAARVAAPVVQYQGNYEYMCGLLHDIGEARVYRILDNMPGTASDPALLKRLVQKYHCIAGAEVAMTWKLPTEIVDCCAAHHDPNAMGSPHVKLVMIADAVVEAIEAIQLGKPERLNAFEQLGIPPETARLLIERTRNEGSNSKRPERA